MFFQTVEARICLYLHEFRALVVLLSPGRRNLMLCGEKFKKVNAFCGLFVGSQQYFFILMLRGWNDEIKL